MEQQNSQSGPIGIGAVVQASDGLIGTVRQVIMQPGTNQVAQILVENDNKDKLFTIPASLIAGQMGSQVIHLSVARDELLNSSGVTMEVDTNTANFGHPTPPAPDFGSGTPPAPER
jgi:hypothetical protein